tara:strand:+ start:3216 stop:3500 length:285 start_codon:yes stop_codon:yes gene_type:complete
MIKQIKQDRKKLKTFKKGSKCIHYESCEMINGKTNELVDEYIARDASKKKKKKKMPKNEEVFGTKETKDVVKPSIRIKKLEYEAPPKRKIKQRR